ncbi:tRNA guanine-N7--methyltransferase [Heterostelium album PN500]|uniref:tRNA (guanine-N(7)-)-methyltransferase n=1 Tax=Heterostelium pallidum (strain ATCC 26659 / Pp 5 / PN500) TaxID=670386 RepID=D3BLE5_HETP5|nr:tRNA guanine-N7--methyltransferase [Heterostelium album PN500]EFA77879.1 tRNA guanine-N7--methyltransferase [Heterostelium album PN500]|eukprot:XP_020430007.1 tRNA guanine-N7--methyltransferase [Heterostelium album PN500]
MSESSTTTTTTNSVSNTNSNNNNKRANSANTTEKKKKPIKPYHRIKAHANPQSDSNFDYPVSPSCYDWSKHYNKTLSEQPEKRVTIADVGCGYGGLLVGLASTFPDRLALGLEIRDKVVQYVEDRIEKLRKDNEEKNQYQNISVLKTNAMKYLPNLFYKGQLEKIFFLFPDPHFKKANHKRRIISPALLAEYAYVIKVGGLAYFISDVEELYLWMHEHFKGHPLFEEVKLEPTDDPCIPLILNATEEGRKVNRIDGKKWYGVFRRIEAPTSNNTSQ